jgi:predicted RNase H-like nuclease (RuvC/YqgF family)
MYQEELNELRAQHESAAEIMAILTLNNSSLSEARENAMRLEIENSNLKAQIEQLRAGGSAAIAAKDAVIKKLEGEKERLVHYTKKNLEKFQEKLKEKNNRIEMLDMKAANEKVAQKREEKLIYSAIYELGLGLMVNNMQ